MQRMVGFFVSTLLQIYKGILTVKYLWRSVNIWQNYGHAFVVSLFGPPCTHKQSSDLFSEALPIFQLRVLATQMTYLHEYGLDVRYV